MLTTLTRFMALHGLTITCAWLCLPQGTHAELMGLPHGSYARLVAAQSRDQQQHGAEAKR